MIRKSDCSCKSFFFFLPLIKEKDHWPIYTFWRESSPPINVSGFSSLNMSVHQCKCVCKFMNWHIHENLWSYLIFSGLSECALCPFRCQHRSRLVLLTEYVLANRKDNCQIDVAHCSFPETGHLFAVIWYGKFSQAISRDSDYRW